MIFQIRFVFIVYFLLSISACYCQDFSVDAGLTGRATIFYLKGLRQYSSGPIRHLAPFSYTSGVDGLGLNGTFNYALHRNWGITIATGTTARYDYYYYDRDRDRDKVIRTFYFDQSIFLTKNLFSNIFIGFGSTWFNIGKELRYNDEGEDKVLPLHFNSIDFLTGWPIWKINIEFKLSIVQEGFPGHIKDNATIGGIRIFYKFPVMED